MKEIVYLNHTCARLPEGKEKGRWNFSDIVASPLPIKCKVTINKNIVIDNVYVYHKDNGPYILYKDYEIYPVRMDYDSYYQLIGKEMVLEFKSDDFVIQSCE
jgi:hypothetical protein